MALKSVSLVAGPEPLESLTTELRTKLRSVSSHVMDMRAQRLDHMYQRERKRLHLPPVLATAEQGDTGWSKAQLRCGITSLPEVPTGRRGPGGVMSSAAMLGRGEREVTTRARSVTVRDKSKYLQQVGFYPAAKTNKKRRKPRSLSSPLSDAAYSKRVQDKLPPLVGTARVKWHAEKRSAASSTTTSCTTSAGVSPTASESSSSLAVADPEEDILHFVHTGDQTALYRVPTALDPVLHAENFTAAAASFFLRDEEFEQAQACLESVRILLKILVDAMLPCSTA
ncbi:unnamed protein product, partial [Amoebophrya sp. A120]|eukprot:GSA120T00002490001.1